MQYPFLLMSLSSILNTNRGLHWCKCCAVVTCEIKLFWNTFDIISLFYFTRNHVWNWNKIISAADGILKLFQNYFIDIEHIAKYSWHAINLWNNFEISCKFPRAEIKLFQADVDEGWNNSITRTWLRYVRVICYRKSVCRLSVVVCNVGVPYSGHWSFRQYFFAAVYLSHPLTSRKILWRSSQGNPSTWCVKRKRGSKIQRFWTCRRLYLANSTRYGLGYN